MALPKHQVFISFRGEDVRKGFLSFLEDELTRGCVKYYVDHREMKGEALDILLQRIEESRIVLVILSKNYMDSKWCIKELLKTCEKIGPRLKAIPIFYNVIVEDVKNNWKVGEQVRAEEGEAIEEEREKQVKQALMTLTRQTGMRSAEFRTDFEFVKEIVKEVKKVLTSIEEKEKSSSNITPIAKLFGITQRQQKLQEKLKFEKDNEETRIVGVLGMAGIGKTTLVEKLFEDGKYEFHRKMFFKDIHKTSTCNGTISLRFKLLKTLLKSKKNLLITEETTHESVEKDLLEGKVLLVLDNVSDKKQLESLLGNRKWIKEGSKIVIVTSDKALVEGLVDDIYVVPGLNEREGLECFRHHAICENRGKSIVEENLTKLSREFVDYARGNPLTLKVLCSELRGKDSAHWESMLRRLAQSPSQNIQYVLNVSYDGLIQQQKDAFLDVTCFFRSENHNFVTALVDSSCNDGEPKNVRSDIKDLADKFLIEISGGRVEMHGLLYTLGKKLASQQHQRLWNCQEIIKVLKKKQAKINVKDIRGIFLDMSEVVKMTPLGKDAFLGMYNLRYLKIYNSCFPREYEADCKLNFPDGLDLPLKEIRYLDWLKFPKEELPQDFNPKNLIDLKLPYSKIKHLWDGVKDTTNLMWADLSHSIDLCDISGLLGAQNLQRLNLEGCTELKILPEGLQNMASLVVLNMRGCTNLVSLAEMNMKSLKTLILSNCSNLEKFQVISENLEALYLDGTALKGLTPSTIKLQKLVLLNLKDCKMLESVPNCLGKMKALQEVILSGCLKLKSFPDLEESMRRLRILLLDGTSIEQVPKLLPYSGVFEWLHRGVKGMPLLRHLCLRGNNTIQSLHPHIGQLYLLKCIDLKYCTKLKSIPTLPPNLQCLDAHGCESLITVGNPLAFLILTDQIHSTFIFSNCHKLDEVAKSSIISYIQKKSQLMSHALDRYNLGSMESFIGACFPGCEIPAWFSHQTYGSKIVLTELRKHWNNNKITGVALCAVISFTNYKERSHPSLVTCTCEFKNEDGSLKRFSCTVGVIKPQKLQSDHVFIGYTSWYQIKKQKEQEDDKKGCSSSDDDKAYLRFEVTDSTGEVVKKCQVLQCGFSLVYEADEIDGVSWEVNSSEATEPRMGDERTSGLLIGTNNLCEYMKKPLQLMCFVVSIYVGVAFVLGKRNRKR
ncbi:Disease resistance protein RPS4 [Cardamine amara subsp. amara]|uniref:ADP-ribosyl cyclase/cyclic ADP-ribose hydrolase n=1 Tax=Cardamine amara subsp. amara TaxID=228776 RepID=A0ABD1C0H8_CARAN